MRTLLKFVGVLVWFMALLLSACGGGSSPNTLPKEITWRLDANLAGSNPSIFTVGVLDAGNGHFGLAGKSCYTVQESPKIEDCGPIFGNAEFINNKLEISLVTLDTNDRGTVSKADDFMGSLDHHLILDPQSLSGTYTAFGVYGNNADAAQDVLTDFAYTGTVTLVKTLK